MTTGSIIRAINKLPFNEKIPLVEYKLKTIKQEKEHTLENAVFSLYNDNKTDK